MPKYGSPPPARGAPLPGCRPSHSWWITPACAGSTLRARLICRGCRITPACAGSTWGLYPGPVGRRGSPPPARGAPVTTEVGALFHRITPACAGSTPGDAIADPFGGGSPPPARGAHNQRLHPDRLLRITPACAGSTYMDGSKPRQINGSPPPARGALGRTSYAAKHPGITPACAGSTLPNQGYYVKERRISFTPSRSTGSHGPPVMRKSSPCSLRAA